MLHCENFGRTNLVSTSRFSRITRLLIPTGDVWKIQQILRPLSFWSNNFSRTFPRRISRMGADVKRKNCFQKTFINHTVRPFVVYRRLRETIKTAVTELHCGGDYRVGSRAVRFHGDERVASSSRTTARTIALLATCSLRAVRIERFVETAVCRVCNRVCVCDIRRIISRAEIVSGNLASSKYQYRFGFFHYTTQFVRSVSQRS